MFGFSHALAPDFLSAVVLLAGRGARHRGQPRHVDGPPPLRIHVNPRSRGVLQDRAVALQPCAPVPHQLPRLPGGVDVLPCEEATAASRRFTMAPLACLKSARPDTLDEVRSRIQSAPLCI